MKKYIINKGIGKSIELFGVPFEYLKVMVACFLISITTFISAYNMGLPLIISILIFFILFVGFMSAILWVLKKAGPDGIYKLIAKMYKPKGVRVNKRLISLINEKNS